MNISSDNTPYPHSSVRDQVSPAEWQLRCELAAAHRLVAHFIFVDMTYNHISVRLPGTHAALAAFVELCEFVVPAALSKPVCRDADDDVVLATALAAKADIIVTGDNDLLVLKEFHGIRILPPRQFMELLSA